MRGKGVEIVVSKGRFDTVELAACSEKSVKWFVPDTDADAVTQCYGALELKTMLKELFRHSTQKTPSISFIEPSEETRVPELRIILQRQKNVKVKNDEGYSIRAGKEGKIRTITITAGTRKGILNGVYRYLEELGMRWTSPEQPQAVWPERVILWKKGMHIHESPCFELRGYYGENTCNTPEKPLAWMARNRMNFGGPGLERPEFAKKLGLLLVGGGHVFEKIFDPDRKIKGEKKLYDTRPEWFAFRNGKRERARGHVCISNPDAMNFLLDNAVSIIVSEAKNIDAYRFWPPDVWHSWCECKDCTRNGNDADRYLCLVHELRKRLDAEYEKGKIDHRIILFFIIYEGSGIYPPPTRPFPRGFDMEMNQMEVWPINRCYVHRQADPQCREFNKHYWDDMKCWLKVFKGKKIMGEYYNVSQYRDTATVFSRVMFDDVRDYAEAQWEKAMGEEK